MGLLDFLNKNKTADKYQEGFVAGVKQGELQAEQNVLEIAKRVAMDPMVQWTPSKKKPPFPLYPFDNPSVYHVPSNPGYRPHQTSTVAQLREFARVCDVLRACINHLCAEVSQQRFDIVPRDKSDDSKEIRSLIQKAKGEFERKGRIGLPGESITTFERKVLEDVLILGNCAIYKKRDKAGRLMRAVAIDAGTIRPNVTAYGWLDDEVAYEQWVLGTKVAEFKGASYEEAKEVKKFEFAQDEMIYTGIFPSTNSPYFQSPIEWLVEVLGAWLLADAWNRAWLSKGRTPGMIITVPEDWTPEDIYQQMEYLERAFTTVEERQGLPLMLAGQIHTNASNRKDQDFGEYNQLLISRTCAIMGVQPSSIGFSEGQYKSAVETASSTTKRIGVASLLKLRKEIYDELLDDMGFPELEISEPKSSEESALDTINRLVTMTGVPIATINEARREIGLHPIAGDMYDEILINNQAVAGGGQPNQVKGGISPTPETAKPSTKKQTPSVRTQDAVNDLLKWEKKSTKRFKEGRHASTSFDSPHLEPDVCDFVTDGLKRASSLEDIQSLFRQIKLEHETKSN